MADAGFKLKVEGEAEFNAALRQINENIKLNKSEIRMLSEQYNASGGDISKLAEKGEVLQNNISQQTQKVEEMRTMYAKASQTLDDHDTRMVTLKTSINNEAAALAKMTAEFNKNQNAIDESNRSTTQFEDALADIDSMLKVNSSELEKLNSLYGDNAKSADTLSAKEKTLTSSIEAQEKKISALKNALSKAESQYGSSSKEANQYRESINKAESELNTMNKSLDENRTAMNRTGHSGKQFIETLNKIEIITGVQIPENIKGMIGQFGLAAGAVKAVSTVAIEASKKIADMYAETVKWADGVLTSSSITGIDTATYQILEFVSGVLDIDVDTVSESLKSLTEKMYEAKDGTGEIALEFMNLKVPIHDTNGELRDSYSVFIDLIEQYGKIENQTERNARMMKIFGESARQLNPFIEAGSEELKRYTKLAYEMGYILDEVGLKKLSKTQSAWDIFANRISAVSKTASSDMLSTISTIISFTGAIGNPLAILGTITKLIKGFSTGFEFDKKILQNLFGGLFGHGDIDYISNDIPPISKEDLERFLKSTNKYARGTYNAPGGLAVVGEEGPEIVELPTGARVYPHGKAPDGLYGGTTNYYSISIPAKDIKEFNDIIHIAENEKMSKRMGKTR